MMPTWMVYSGYVLHGLAAFAGLLIFALTGLAITHTHRDPMDKFGYPIMFAIALAFLFAAFWVFASIKLHHPYEDDLEHRVRIGSDNEAVFLGGQAEKYSLEYRLFRRWQQDHVWLPNETEKP